MMSTLTTLFLVPLGIAIIGLIIEYWFIQPVKDAINPKKASHSKKKPNKATKTGNSLGSYLARLLSANTLSVSLISARFIEKVGFFLIVIPTFLISLMIAIIAVPLFVMLFYSEKYNTCNFHPTCKEYLVKSIEIHGTIKGFWLSIKRIVRCNPFVVGGHDPVPQLHEPHRFKVVLGSHIQLMRGFQLMLKGILFAGLFSLVWSGILVSVGKQRLLILTAKFSEHITLTIILLLLLWSVVLAVQGYLLVAFLRKSWRFVLVVYIMVGIVLALAYKLQ